MTGGAGLGSEPGPVAEADHLCRGGLRLYQKLRPAFIGLFLSGSTAKLLISACCSCHEYRGVEERGRLHRHAYMHSVGLPQPSCRRSSPSAGGAVQAARLSQIASA